MNKFIEFLDSYNKKQINYFDLIDILKATDFDFHSNNYIDTKCNTTIDWQKLKNKEKKVLIMKFGKTSMSYLSLLNLNLLFIAMMPILKIYSKKNL